MIYIFANLIVLCGFFVAQQDKVQFDFYESLWKKWPKFFNPKVSFLNKYKQLPGMYEFIDSDGVKHYVHEVDKSKERFPGSTTFLVWFTDGWHLFKVAGNTCMAVALTLVIAELYKFNLWYAAAAFLAVKMINGVSFSIFYKIK